MTDSGYTGLSFLFCNGSESSLTAIEKTRRRWYYKMKRRYPEVTIAVVCYGDIRLVLYPEIAPNTVANFISLASKGFYDGLSFHRIIKGYVLQAEDPDDDGMGDPGYRIRGEFIKMDLTTT